MKTGMMELNEKFSELSSEHFYAWIWNNRERLLDLEKEQIVTAHGNKLKNNQGVENYEYWFSGEDYYDKYFKK